MMTNNMEMISRFRTAAGYQKQAIRALFPERMSGHLDVIENEIKLMITEAAMEMLKEAGSSCFSSAFVDEKESAENKNNSKKNSKKVDID